MMNNITPAVKQLLIINIMIFIGAQLIAPINGLFSLYYFENPNFRIWQPLTHMFMHGNVLHIFFNMFALVSFGSLLEQFWGAKKFLFFYFSCGIGAFLLHTGVNYYYYHDGLETLVSAGIPKADIINILNQRQVGADWQQILSASSFDHFISSYLSVAVGASGAIYGLLIAFAFMFPDAELAMLFIPIPIKAKYFVPGIVAMDFVFGITSFTGDDTAHFAHIGGAIVGFIMMWSWRNRRFNQNRWN